MGRDWVVWALYGCWPQKKHWEVGSLFPDVLHSGEKSPVASISLHFSLSGNCSSLNICKGPEKDEHHFKVKTCLSQDLKSKINHDSMKWHSVTCLLLRHSSTSAMHWTPMQSTIYCTPQPELREIALMYMNSFSAHSWIALLLHSSCYVTYPTTGNNWLGGWMSGLANEIGFVKKKTPQNNWVVYLEVEENISSTNSWVWCLLQWQVYITHVECLSPLLHRCSFEDGSSASTNESCTGKCSWGCLGLSIYSICDSLIAPALKMQSTRLSSSATPSVILGCTVIPALLYPRSHKGTRKTMYDTSLDIWKRWRNL